MFPINNWKKLKRGYVFKQKTWYTKYHLGLDIICPIGTPIYSPFDGEVIAQLNGEQGGLTVWFKPKHDDVVMRFMHNSKFKKKGKVKEGDIIAYSGNTGKCTSGPHSHIDCSKHVVKLTDINNFLDPEKYDWSSKAKKEPKKKEKVEVKQIPIEQPKQSLEVKNEPLEAIKENIKVIDGTKIEHYNIPPEQGQEIEKNAPIHETRASDAPLWKIILNIIKLWTKKQ